MIFVFLYRQTFVTSMNSNGSIAGAQDPEPFPLRAKIFSLVGPKHFLGPILGKSLESSGGESPTKSHARLRPIFMAINSCCFVSTSTSSSLHLVLRRSSLAENVRGVLSWASSFCFLFVCLGFRLRNKTTFGRQDSFFT